LLSQCGCIDDPIWDVGVGSLSSVIATKFPEEIKTFKSFVEDFLFERLRSELREYGSGSQKVVASLIDLKWFTQPYMRLYDPEETLQVCEKLFQAFDGCNRSLEVTTLTESAENHPLWSIIDLIPTFQRSEECISIYEKAFSLLCPIPGAIME
jgi:hypothetical protein